MLAVAGAALALAAWAALTAWLVAAALQPSERQAVAALLGPRLPLVVLAWIAGSAVLAWVLNQVWHRQVRAPARLLEATRILGQGGSRTALDAAGGNRELRALAAAIAELAAERDRLRDEVAQEVARASKGVQQERNRLAALMSELSQSVIVCNLDGRILLYNNRARLQVRTLSQTPRIAGGAELIGIGRSIYAVLDRELVAHALDDVGQRLARGATHPSSQFVTATRSGQLMRVQLAPVVAADATANDGTPGRIGGFVLMLDIITRSFEEALARDQLLHELVESSRASLASQQAALEMLALPDVDETMRERFMAVVRQEERAMATRLEALVRSPAYDLRTRWPLEDMRGADLVEAARRRIEAHCERPVAADDVDPRVWLRVDSFSLLQALASLSCRLVDEFGIRYLQLRLRAAGERAQLDLVWSGPPISTETVIHWERDPMRLRDQSLPLSVRDVVDRHGAEMWFERERVRHEAFFRFLLPLAPAAGAADTADDALALETSRPEYFDFDLFRSDDIPPELDERPLAALAYTVFDTETTGLAPSQGDQIIQIGATRIVNGKLLRHECFDQLVDPGRAIPAASIPIHGITGDMVAGQPRITEVLPTFHAYAQDTVLVAHNAAFDMRFLQLQEAAAGVAFRQPVLDTLLLSAVVHANQASHRLEDIAARFDIPLLGRHTALGDALVTAEILLRLIPLLEAMGIRTLRQAREASERTFYARLRY
nr:3'-5' exonuclease [Ramlibacter aurantiacus]